jgi:hypothetical protein
VMVCEGCDSFVMFCVAVSSIGQHAVGNMQHQF